MDRRSRRWVDAKIESDNSATFRLAMYMDQLLMVLK